MYKRTYVLCRLPTHNFVVLPGPPVVNVILDGGSYDPVLERKLTFSFQLSFLYRVARGSLSAHTLATNSYRVYNLFVALLVLVRDNWYLVYQPS